MKTIQKIFTVMLLLPAGLCWSQTLPLKQGDQLSAVYGNLYNTSLQKLDPALWKDKVLIIDFWSTWCGSCISGLEKMDALQKKYRNEIFILPVNFQSRAVVDKFWKANHITRKLSLPTIVGDTLLEKLFPHHGVPLIVWIGRDGRYLTATESEFVNEAEIERLLKGEAPQFITALPKSYLKDEEFLIGGKSNLDNGQGFFYSGFTAYQPAMRPNTTIVVDSIHKTIKITVVNQSIRAMYAPTKNSFPDINGKRQKINVSDVAMLKYDKSSGYQAAWNMQHKYCYELFWPLDSTLDTAPAYDKMRNDLNAFFPFDGQLKEIITPCYVVQKLPGQEFRGASGLSTGKPPVSLSRLVRLLNDNFEIPVVVCDIKGADTILIDYKPKPGADFESLNADLKAFGLQLIKADRPIMFFILNDKKKSS